MLTPRRQRTHGDEDLASDDGPSRGSRDDVIDCSESLGGADVGRDADDVGRDADGRDGDFSRSRVDSDGQRRV